MPPEADSPWAVVVGPSRRFATPSRRVCTSSPVPAGTGRGFEAGFALAFAVVAVRGAALRAVVLAAATALLLLVTALTFRPALSGEFLSWDDRAYVTGNPHLKEPGGLRKLWDLNEPTRDQYYPLLFTTYWAEYRIWQGNPFGYHAVNLGLHLANVVLVALLAQAIPPAPAAS